MKKSSLLILTATLAACWCQPLALLQAEDPAAAAPVPAGVPIGSISAFAGRMDPAFETRTGWMHCDGRALDKTKPENASLFEAIGASWGGDGKNSFHLPDLQGLFLRGVDGISGRDPDKLSRTASQTGGHAKNQVGSVQNDALGAHGHNAVSASEAEPHRHNYQQLSADGATKVAAAGEASGLTEKESEVRSVRVTTETKIAATGEKETRPKNAYVHWIIRVR